MSGLSNFDIQKLAKGLEVSRDFGYSNVVGSAVVYFDWLLTLDAEIKLVWKAKGSKMKILYLLTRYLPLVYSPLLLYYRFGNPTVSECTAVYRSIGILFTVAAICAALVVTLRTWAVWDLKKPMTYLLFGTYTVTSILILILYIISWKYTSHSVISGLPLGCIPEFQSFYLPAGFVSEAAYDTLILLLMLVRGASLYRWGRNSLLFQTLYRDGIMFYIYITTLSVANVVLLFSKSDYDVLMLHIQGAVRSVSACRIILHVRMHYDELQMKESSTITSDERGAIKEMSREHYAC